MVLVKTYKLPPTKLIPNSPYPVLHYSGCLSQGTTCDAAEVYDVISKNGWQTHWIFRYGQTQKSHYHSRAHECMAVLSGKATIRFGVADTVTDLEESAHEEEGTQEGKEEGGIEVQAEAGDIFILPAGVAHKTFNAVPSASFKLLTPGDGHHIDAEDKRAALAAIPLDGFTMIGSYPANSDWDFAVGGEDEGNYESVWSVEKPARDPYFGLEPEGLCTLWSGETS